MATLNGTLIRPNGVPVAGYVRFRPIGNPTVVASSLSIASIVDVALDEDGSFTTELSAGTYWVNVAGVHPWQILISDADGTYRLESIVIWPVLGQTGSTVWIKNDDDSLYYQIKSSGSGDGLGIVVDPNGSSSPSGFLATTIWLKSSTDGNYYEVNVTGSGDSLSLGFVSSSGSASPSGVKLDELTVPSMDGNWTNRIIVTGSGETIGLEVH